MGLKEFLSRHRLVGIDTMVFIYYLADHPSICSPTWALVRSVGERRYRRGDLRDHAP